MDHTQKEDVEESHQDSKINDKQHDNQQRQMIAQRKSIRQNFEGGTSSAPDNSTSNSQANLLDAANNNYRVNGHVESRNQNNNRARGSKSREQNIRNGDPKRNRSGEGSNARQKHINGNNIQINGNGNRVRNQEIAKSQERQRKSKKEENYIDDKIQSKNREVYQRNEIERDRQRNRKKVQQTQENLEVNQLNQQQNFINFHQQQQTDQMEDSISQDPYEIAIQEGSRQKNRKYSSDKLKANETQKSPRVLRGTPQNEQSEHNQASKSMSFKTEIESQKLQNGKQLPKPQRNSKIQNVNLKVEKKKSNKGNFIDSVRQKQVFTNQKSKEPDQDRRNGKRDKSRSNYRNESQHDQDIQFEEQRNKVIKKRNGDNNREENRNRGRDQSQFNDQDQNMLEENSFDQLLPQENNNFRQSNGRLSKNSKIGIDNNQIKQQKNRNQPIKVNYNDQLQNGDDLNHKSIEISQDILNNHQIEYKKNHIFQGIGKKVKQMMTGSKKRSQSALQEQQSLFQEDRTKFKEKDLKQSSKINKKQQKSSTFNNVKEKSNLKKSDKQQRKSTTAPKVEEDKEIQNQIKAKNDENSSDSSQSITLDPSKMNRKEYFDAFKKKGRKNLLSLKGLNLKTKHQKEIELMELHPRNIMRIEEEQLEEILLENKTLYQRIGSWFNKCLKRNGCNRLQSFIFGQQKNQPQMNEAVLGFKTRQDQQLKKMKAEEKEKSDTEMLWREKRLIKLNHPIRVKWDVIIILFTIYCCIELPIEVCYKWRSSSEIKTLFTVFNSIIDCFFAIDIIMNFFTTYFHPTTGEEIDNKRDIAMNYLKGMFILDVLSTVPLDLMASAFFENRGMQAEDLQVISILKIIRVFRLSKLIAFLNATDEIKLNLQLFKTMFLILLYIHILGCAWYMYGNYADQLWEPGQSLPDPDKTNFFEYPFEFKFFVSLYTSVLALCGNDIFPVQWPFQYIMACLYLLMGALMQAYMFGNLAVMVQQLNRKSQSFQEKLDLANTSMRNMRLDVSIQTDIRDFMTRTQSNLDNQKELNQFLMLISPTLRVQVTTHIFQTAIAKNQILVDQEQVMYFLINKITPRLKLPEDIIFQQNDNQEKFLCLIARGKCEVSVSNNMKKSVKQKEIQPGDYFGEICLIYDCPRTATVMSMDYSIFAELTQDHFNDLWNEHPDFYEKMKQEIYKNYSDEWIAFKIKLLKQVDYFVPKKKKKLEDENSEILGSQNEDQGVSNAVNNKDDCNDKFFHEIQFFMQEKIYQKGTFIQEAKQRCEELIFVVNGMVEVQVQDSQGDYHTLEQLLQGSIVGQYAVHSELPMFTSVRAATAVRVLTLSRHFFENFGLESSSNSKNFVIDGLEKACHKAKKQIKVLQDNIGEDQFSLPQCDFKLFERIQLKCKGKIRRRHIDRFRSRVKIMLRLKQLNFKNLTSKLKLQQQIEEMGDTIQHQIKDQLQDQIQKQLGNFMPGQQQSIQSRGSLNSNQNKASNPSNFLNLPNNQSKPRTPAPNMTPQNPLASKAESRKALMMQNMAVARQNANKTKLNQKNQMKNRDSQDQLSLSSPNKAPPMETPKAINQDQDYQRQVQQMNQQKQKRQSSSAKKQAPEQQSRNVNSHQQSYSRDAQKSNQDKRYNGQRKDAGGRNTTS